MTSHDPRISAPGTGRPADGGRAGDETLALMRLTLARGLGSILIGRLLEQFGSASAACGAGVDEIASIDGISREGAALIRRELESGIDDAKREIAWAEENGVHLVGLGSPQYPGLLALIPDPPPVLYMKGEFVPRQDVYSLAIVGTRRCSAYGRDQAGRLSALLAQAGLTIVSGGARGIDSEAHRGALRGGGRTIVVAGCGLSHVYPQENAELFKEIVRDGRGAVVSEFPMEMPPSKENFPRRNRIISGLALGTLVVEASARSGALITARLACEDHNREVMAVPGRADAATSAGCHRIIREGWGRLVTNAAEVLEGLEGAAGLVTAAGGRVPEGRGVIGGTGDGGPESVGQDSSLFSSPGMHNLTDVQKSIVTALADCEVELNALAAATNLEIGPLQAQLTMLEIRGLVSRSPGGGVRRAR